MPSTRNAPATPAEGPRARTRARRGDAVSKGDRTESAIIEAACTLLAKEPVSSITIERLSTMVGVSRPTIYFYFDSREAVLRTAVGRFIADLEAAVAGALPRRGALLAGLDPMVRALLEFSRERSRAVRSVFAVQDTDPSLVGIVGDAIGRISAAVGDLIDAEREAGTAPDGPPARPLAAALVLMVIRVAALSELPDRADWSADRMVRDLGVIWQRAIFVTSR